MFQNRNIRVLFAISFLQGLVFYAAVATLYRRAAGLDMFQIAAIERVSLLLSLALEVPWGIAAERIGYRKTMILCSFLLLLSKVIFWRAESFGGFLAERVVLAVACAGTSGVDESILVSSCPKNETHRAFGWYSAFGTAGLISASAVYSLFIGENFRLAALLTVFSHALAAVLTLLLTKTNEPEQENRQTAICAGRVLLRLVRTKRLLMFVISSALFAECVQIITVFLNQLQYERCGWSASWMGIAYIAASAVMLFSAASAGCARRMGERRMGITLMGTGAAICAALAATSSGAVSFVCLMALGLCGSLMMPLSSEIINRMIADENRATALSMTALFTNSTAIVLELFAGRVTDFSLPAALMVCGMLCAAAMCLFAFAPKS